MSRTPGKRNAGYEQKRLKLLNAIADRLLQPGGERVSLRDLASAASVSIPTIKHYFRSRDQAVCAALALLHQRGAPHIQNSATAEVGDVQQSLNWYLIELVRAWRKFGVGRVFSAGLVLGYDHEYIGPTYVNEILEPTLQAAETRLARHMDRGELRRASARTAALQLVSPIFLALIHQDTLLGDRCRPLDVDALIGDHLQFFLRAYAVES